MSKEKTYEHSRLRGSEPHNRSSTLMSAYKHIEHQQFLYYVIKEKAEIYNALKTFFRKREAVGRSSKSDRSEKS